MRDDFCVFILTHGRPSQVHTYNTLEKLGYTGKVFLVIDDEDKTEDEYRARFGDKVLQFNKTAVANQFDEANNFDQHRKVIVYARNACWELARQVGCRYFCQMDDDYTGFEIRFNGQLQNSYTFVKHTIDDILMAILEFLSATSSVSVAMSQGGDHIGGVSPSNTLRLHRKCMNSFFCDTTRQFMFFGYMNEDVNSYVTYGRRGLLFFTVLQAMLRQKTTQAHSGGMSEAYLDSGTYVKSFYTVMAVPSCVKIGLMGDPAGTRARRIHHKINWHNTAPKILAEQYRKASQCTES